MKNLLFVIISILITYPAFALCPIDMEGASCVASESPSSIPVLRPTEQKPSALQPTTDFLETQSNVEFSREIQPTKNLRKFGVSNQNFGYNSNCQFGTCLDTGTPKTFPIQQD